MDKQDEGKIAARLAEQIFKGSEVSEAALVKRYSRGLFYLLRNRVGDDEVARDLCQDTLYKAIGKLREARLDEPKKLAHWLSRFAGNLASNYVRKQARRQTYADDGLAQKTADPRLGPEAQLSREQSSAIVRELVLELKLERDREILRRTYELDQDKDQIIEEVDGLSSARDYHRVLSRAKARLRELVLERWGGQELVTQRPGSPR